MQTLSRGRPGAMRGTLCTTEAQKSEAAMRGRESAGNAAVQPSSSCLCTSAASSASASPKPSRRKARLGQFMPKSKWAGA
eukprot:CAMPEP_0180669142 /NCGR_PEP_ID=MMETSP1037_2-20121125/63316_1 /TAXON_ID=632150 /ORGANISM="Azadinium spinosum, Strain 3D9" /LENGTH=79 /DNA_ID=CAMNT_0022697949 /DNA_START=474 /DNA_END=710 /DNA_ORIENTATION=+